MKYSDTVVLLFAKAPVSGKVNTRLIPAIGVDLATQLQSDLIHQRLSLLSQSQLCHVVLYCLPDTHHAFFKACAEHYPVTLKSQDGINLGERMGNAIESELRTFKQVIVIGTDAPSLDIGGIEEAILALRNNADESNADQSNDVVLVPAIDGGYVLIGMRHYHKALFLTVPWGTERVLVKTRANGVAAGLKMVELDECWDIDRPEDYARYVQEKLNSSATAPS